MTPMKLLLCSPLLLATICNLSFVIPLPAADPAAVLALFDQKCADCHSEGDETPTLTAGINLTSLLGSEDDVKSILDRVQLPDAAKGRMPKSKGQPGDPGYTAPLRAEEIALLKAWAKGETKPEPSATAKSEPKAPSSEPRTKNEEPRTKNQEPRTGSPVCWICLRATLPTFCPSFPTSPFASFNSPPCPSMPSGALLPAS